MPDQDEALELWQTIRTIYRTALRKLNARLAQEGITFPQYSVILALGRHGPMQMNRLGEFMLVAPANVTGLIDRMERKGYVRRRRDPEDRRLYVVELTDLGAKIFRSISSRFRQYARGLSSSLTDEELKSALEALRKVRDAVEGETGI